MRHSLILILALFACATIPSVAKAPTQLGQVNPWDCAVSIVSHFVAPTGKLTKSSTLLMNKIDNKLIMGQATGTVIGRKGSILTILTAKHVVEDAKDYSVNIHGIFLEGYNERHSQDADIAIFYIDAKNMADKVSVAPLGESVPHVGSRLDTIGNALGEGLRWMTPGPVASESIYIILKTPVHSGAYHSYPGCSGSGVWSDGKLVGVVSMVACIRLKTGENITLADMSYFVGVEEINKFLTTQDGVN